MESVTAPIIYQCCLQYKLAGELFVRFIVERIAIAVDNVDIYLVAVMQGAEYIVVTKVTLAMVYQVGGGLFPGA